MVRSSAILALFIASCSDPESSAPAAADGGLADTTAGDSGVKPTNCWSDKLGDLQDYASALQLHPSGDVIVQGVFQGEIDFGGTKLNAPMTDSGLNLGSFVARLRKSDGTAVWARTVGETSQVRFLGALAIDPGGNVVVGGSFGGTLTDLGGIVAPDPKGGGFLARLDGETGKTLVAQPLDVSSGPRVLRRASDGTYVAAGTYGDYARLGATPLMTTASTDVWFARVSLDDGTIRWARRVGDGGSDSIQSFALTNTDDVMVAANLRGSGSITTYAYIAKLAAADGAVAWEHSYPSMKALDSRVAVVLGDELVVLGTMQSATSFGGNPVVPDKTSESAWLARWAITDGAPRGSWKIASSSTGDERPNIGGSIPGGTLWYLSPLRFRVIDPVNGELTNLQPGAQLGDYDIPNRRWYSANQGSIVCTEAH